MSIIKDILIKYHNKLDYLDLELLIAHVIKKSREFVLSHPEYQLTKFQISNFKFQISRRRRGEPMAYILGNKEFFGLDFKVNRHTLIPRPETELLSELAIQETITKKQETVIVDVGTGSGNIIISLAKNLKSENKFIAIDISVKALKIAKYNAIKHKVDKKIKFIKGNLLEPILKNKSYIIPDTKYIILANLPYLSKKIYNATAPNVKKYEPKSALLSGSDGLFHYKKLFKQLSKLKKKCSLLYVSCFMEISPEQKPKITKLIKLYFPQAKTDFYKDLAGKWRVCKISL